MKEKIISIVTPEGRAYYRAVPLAKEFFDKDRNVVHTTGALPEGALEEISVSAVTRKTLKNGKLDGKLEVVNLADNKITFSEEYKDGVLVSITGRTAAPTFAKEEKKQTYPGTVLKTRKGAHSFYINGREVAEETVSAGGVTLELLGNIPDGEAKEFDENGQICTQAHYKNNKLNGEMLRYASNGKVISQENYVNGLLQGEARYFMHGANGTEQTVCFYKNSLLEGARTTTYPDGTPCASEPYVKGRLTGLRRTFYPNGNPECEENFKEGKRCGERKLFFPQGGLWYQENYKNGRLDGERKAFFPSGAKRLEEWYADGMLEGARKIFAENGDVLTDEEYHWGALVRDTERSRRHEN